MRIAVFSDVHANWAALAAALAAMEEEAPDFSVFLGDLVMNGPHPGEVFERVAALKPYVWLKGNTDNWFDEIGEGFVPADEREKYIVSLFDYARERLDRDQIAFIRRLPEKRMLYSGGQRILCCHGSPRRVNEPVGDMTSEEDLEAIVRGMPADILLCGHTHRPFEAEVCGKRVINAGALGHTAEPGFGILEIDGENTSYRRRPVAYDAEAAAKDAAGRGFPGAAAMRRAGETQAGG